MVTWRGCRQETKLAGAVGRALLVAALIATVTGAPPARAAEPDAPVSERPLNDAQRETFLLEGEVVRDRAIPTGITHPRRVTLRRDGYEHDAKVQTHDEYKSQLRLESHLEIDFRDSWRNNVAAYRLDRILGLGFVPVTVVRIYRQHSAAWMWWIDDVVMSERDRLERKQQPPRPLDWVSQLQVVQVFDQLIYNFDTSVENLLIDKDWRVWMIDHTRAFKIFGELRKEEDLPNRCERHLLAALRRLDRPTLEKAMEGVLDGQQVDGLLARRDKIVRFYDALVAERGAPAVLYELPSRLDSTTGATQEP